MKIIFSILISLSATTILMGDTDAKGLYAKKCATCHGENAQKKALGAARVLNTLNTKQIQDALTGYKKGAYGGKFKRLKTSVVRDLSEDDIQSLSAYIPTLK